MGDLSDYKDARGRFTAGNPGSGVAGPGRPTEAAAQRVRAALTEVLTDDETMSAWVQAMKRKLRKGNLSATQLVFDRTIGKPAVVVTVDGADNLAVFMAQWQAMLVDDEPAALPPGDEPLALESR